jgi:DHA2 family multidrug resistance protein
MSKVRTYSAGVFLMTTLGFVLYGSMVLLPILLQTLLGYPALQAGIPMAPRGIGSFFALPIIGILLGRFDARKLLVLGMLGTALTLFRLSWLNLNAGYWDIFWPQVLQGVSMALLFAPLTTATMDPIPKEEIGNATSIFNLLRNVGGSMGIAAATTHLERRMQRHINLLGMHVNPYNPGTRLMLDQMRSALTARGADPVTATRQAYGPAFGMVQRQAALLSFLETFHALGILFLLVLPLLLLMKRPTRRGDTAPAH